jgi:hypothetical protein
VKALPARLTTIQVETSFQMGSAAVTASIQGPVSILSSFRAVMVTFDLSGLACRLEVRRKGREDIFTGKRLAVPLAQQLGGLRQVVAHIRVVEGIPQHDRDRDQE